MTPVVLHVLEALEGGTARHLVDLVRSVDGFRHVVAIPSHRSVGVTDVTAAPAIAEAGGEVRQVDMRRMPAHPANARAFVELAALVRRERPAIVHGHSSIGGVLSRLLPRHGAAVVYTPNGVARSATALRVERVLGRRTDRLIAVSPSEAEFVVRERLARADRVRTIPNGIDLAYEPPPLDPPLRRRCGIPDDAPVVGTVARLVPQKAPEVFVHACAAVARSHPDVHFVLVGSGPLQSELDAAVATSVLAGRFHQISELRDAASALGELDVFVMTSRFEGGPYAPLEAMRAGVPVVLTDVVGNRDVVVPGESGLLAPDGDADAIGRAVACVLGDDAIRTRLVAGATARLAGAFDLRAMAEATASMYRDLL